MRVEEESVQETTFVEGILPERVNYPTSAVVSSTIPVVLKFFRTLETPGSFKKVLILRATLRSN